MQLSPEQVQSVNILLSAVQVAQRRGASLQDAHTLQEALDKLVPREEQERQAAEAAAAGDSADDEAPVSLQDDSDDEELEADSE